MFGKPSKAHPIDSLVGIGSVIEGSITFSGGLRVDGHVKGDIRASGSKPCSLVLSETAKVEGGIEVAHVIVNGTVAGPITASDYIELLPKARVTGDVTYRAIEIHVGAIIMGQLVHNGKPAGETNIVEFKTAGKDGV